MDKKTALPSYWEIKKMTEVVTWGSGGTPKATEKSYYENGTIPWLIIGDLNDGIVNSSLSKITELGLKNSSAKMIPVGTLLVAMYGSIGKLGITGIECCTNQAIAFAKELHGVTTKYMFYYMSMIKPKLISMGKGGTQKNISQSVLKSLDVVVPPIPEQERIVAKIEELFSKLDASVAELQTAKEKLKVYRQAVLKEALSPEQGWHKYCFADLMECVRNGYGKKPDDIGEYRILRISSVRPGKVELSDFRYNQTPFDEDDLIAENDLLFTRYNGSLEYVGVCACVPQLKEKYAYPDKIIKCTPKLKNPYHSRFLQYCMNQGEARKFIRSKIKTTSGQKGIAGSDIKKTVLWLPELPVQEKIVKMIDEKISTCDSIEQTIATSLQQAEALRQSILKRAFEGGL